VLVEYWNTRSCTDTPAPPDCLSPTTIQLSLDKVDTSIDLQKAQLKPPLPPGTFIDRTTMRMWPTASWPLNGLDALDWTSQPLAVPEASVQRVGDLLRPYRTGREQAGATEPRPATRESREEIRCFDG
jgi:hypothetical protein